MSFNARFERDPEPAPGEPRAQHVHARRRRSGAELQHGRTEGERDGNRNKGGRRAGQSEEAGQSDAAEEEEEAEGVVRWRLKLLKQKSRWGRRWLLVDAVPR